MYKKKADDKIAEFLRIPIIIPEFNSGILRLSYCGLRAQRFMSTTCENSLLVIFFFISICWGASPTKIKQLAHLVGCIISTVLISQQYVKFLIRNPAYQNRIAQWSGKLLSRQHLCTGLRWFFFQEIKNINFLTLVKTNNKNNFLTLVKTNNKRLAFATTQQWYFVIKIVLTYCEKKKILVIEKKFWNSRLKAKNLQKFWKFSAFSLEFQKLFLINRTIFSHSRSEQFW